MCAAKITVSTAAGQGKPMADPRFSALSFDPGEVFVGINFVKAD